MQFFMNSVRGQSVRWLVYDNTEHNVNIHTVWNQLLEDHVSRYFVNLSPDTFPQVGWLDEIVEIMDRVPRLAAMGPSSDRTYNEQANRNFHDLSLVPRDAWVPGTLPSGFACVYRTSALKILGGFREDFIFYGGDLDMCLRLQLAGYLTGWAIHPYVSHVWGEDAKKESNYTELRRIGNEQLEAAKQQYTKMGVWRHAKEGTSLCEETAT